jgi:hypothetical protein
MFVVQHECVLSPPRHLFSADLPPRCGHGC